MVFTYKIRVLKGVDPDTYIEYTVMTNSALNIGDECVILFNNADPNSPLFGGKLSATAKIEMYGFSPMRCVEGLNFQEGDLACVAFIDNDPSLPIAIQNVDTSKQFEVTDFSGRTMRAYPPKGGVDIDTEVSMVLANDDPNSAIILSPLPILPTFNRFIETCKLAFGYGYYWWFYPGGPGGDGYVWGPVRGRLSFYVNGHHVNIHRASDQYQYWKYNIRSTTAVTASGYWYITNWYPYPIHGSGCSDGNRVYFVSGIYVTSPYPNIEFCVIDINESGVVNWQSHTTLEVLPSGGNNPTICTTDNAIYVAYPVYSGAQGIRVRKSSTKSGWSEAWMVTLNMSQANVPQVVPLPSDNIYLMYAASIYSNGVLAGRKIASDGTISPEEILYVADGNLLLDYRVVSNGSTIYVVYAKYDSSKTNLWIYAQTWIDGIGWSTAELLHTQAVGAIGGRNGPPVASVNVTTDSLGAFWAFWNVANYTFTENARTIFYRKKNPGGAWSSADVWLTIPAGRYITGFSTFFQATAGYIGTQVQTHTTWDVSLADTGGNVDYYAIPV